MTIAYPSRRTERDRWILAQRGDASLHSRAQLDPQRPYAFLTEDECAPNGQVVPVATIFLTNRECPWRCLMCDLWRNTLTWTLPGGAIPAQIQHALARLPPARHVKLYNSGSFFDPHAIPPQDDEAVAERVQAFERVVVESHPALIGQRCLRFAQLLRSGRTQIRLEVAMGLETVHPEVLPRLNKRMTPDQFARAAGFLRQNDIDLRAFVLVQPPFLAQDQALHWATRSVQFAFDCQATAVSLIPTRFGSGSLEALAQSGEFTPPRLATLEAALTQGLALGRGRVFADLWDLERFAGCRVCFPARQARLREMNLRQTVPARVECLDCEGSA